MRRLTTFFLGMIAGAVLLCGTLNYHVIRAKEGLHLIPKTHSRLAATYLDIRNFTVIDLANHPEVVQALIRANKQELMESAAVDTLQNGIDRFLDRTGGK
ncbi:MAG: hypothetical protein MK171_10555 [Pirellulales bacterium]|nr:hypothetical protein [Pirellulales bacterium]